MAVPTPRRATRISIRGCARVPRRAGCGISRTCASSARATAWSWRRTIRCQRITGCSFSGGKMAERYDAIVIGVGQAAPALCGRLDKEGLKTAVIERKLLGGTCVNNGCIPTKTLVASAHAAHLARRGGDYGFAAGAVRVDMKAVKRRMDHVVGQSSSGLRKWIAGMKNVTLVRGHAKFIGPRRVSVKSRELEAERVFIDVGARATVPDMPGMKEVPFLTNSTMMDVDFRPP